MKLANLSQKLTGVSASATLVSLNVGRLNVEMSGRSMCVMLLMSELVRAMPGSGGLTDTVLKAFSVLICCLGIIKPGKGK